MGYQHSSISLLSDFRCSVTRHLKLLPPRFPHHSALLSLLTLSQKKPFLLQVVFSTILPWQQGKATPAPPTIWVPQYLYLLTILKVFGWQTPPGSRALHIFLEMSLLFTWDLMVLTFTEVKLCFFLAFRVGKVVKLRFLSLFASIGVLQER